MTALSLSDDEMRQLRDKHTRERLALLGDRVLSLKLTERLLADASSLDVGQITIRKARYEAGASHAGFLSKATKAPEILGDLLDGRNDHSRSGVLEALIALEYLKGTHRLIDQLVAWCDENVTDVQTVPLSSLPRFLFDVFSVNLHTGVLEGVGSGEQQLVVSDSLRDQIRDFVRPAEPVVMAAPLPPAPTSVAISTASPPTSGVSAASAAAHHRHGRDTLQVGHWRSHAKIHYRDWYFTCCSIRLKIERLFEDNEWWLVAMWPHHTKDPGCGLLAFPPDLQNTVHPGKVTGGTLSRRKLAWSCCDWTCSMQGLPGCQTMDGRLVVYIECSWRPWKLTPAFELFWRESNEPIHGDGVRIFFAIIDKSLTKSLVKGSGGYARVIDSIRFVSKETKEELRVAGCWRSFTGAIDVSLDVKPVSDDGISDK